MTTPGHPSQVGSAVPWITPTDQHGPDACEEVAEVLADADPEVLVQRTERDDMHLPLLGPESRVCVTTGERGYDVHPPQETEHLDETGEDSDGRRHRNDAPEPEHLPEQHCPGDQQQSGQHERPPQEDQRRATGPEAFEDLGCGTAQDLGVVEPLAEQGQGGVEPEWRALPRDVISRARATPTQAAG